MVLFERNNNRRKCRREGGRTHFVGAETTNLKCPWHYISQEEEDETPRQTAADAAEAPTKILFGTYWATHKCLPVGCVSPECLSATLFNIPVMNSNYQQVLTQCLTRRLVCFGCGYRWVWLIERGTIVPLHCKRSRVNSRLQILGAEPAGSVRGTATVYCSQQQVLSSCIRLLSLLSELFPVHKFTIITTAFVLLAIFHFLKVLPLHRDEQWNSYDATVDAIAHFCISPDDGNTWC